MVLPAASYSAGSQQARNLNNSEHSPTGRLSPLFELGSIDHLRDTAFPFAALDTAPTLADRENNGSGIVRIHSDNPPGLRFLPGGD